MDKQIGDYVRKRGLRLGCYDQMTGRTTRLADGFVQELFNNLGEWVVIHDHYPGRKADVTLMHIITRRMQIEHNIELEVMPNECKLRIPSDVVRRPKEVRNEKDLS